MTVPRVSYLSPSGTLAVTANKVVIIGAGSTSTIIKSRKGFKGELVSVASKSSATLFS